MKKSFEKQAKLWRYLGWTAPFAALGGIVFFWIFGDGSYLNYFFITICTVFFAISVFWWWWALDKLVDLMKNRFDLENKFVEVIDEIRKLREDFNKEK